MTFGSELRSLVELLSESDADPPHPWSRNSTSLQETASTPPSPQNSLEEPFIETSSFHYEVARHDDITYLIVAP